MTTRSSALDVLNKITIAIAGASIIGMALAEGWQVFARYVLNAAPSWTEPVALFFMATTMMFGAAAGVRSNRHFGFFIFVESREPAARRALQTFARVIAAGIGLMLAAWGGEMMIEAAAESTALKAIVSEGASSRSVRDELANPGSNWQSILGNSFATAATALFTNNLPPQSLKRLVPQIAPRPLFFIYGERGQPMERTANEAFYAAAEGQRALWEVPASGHIGGIDAEPQEYERRVVTFFTRHLVLQHRVPSHANPGG